MSSTSPSPNPPSTGAEASSLALSSHKEQKRTYIERKKYYTKNVHSAIESSPEVHSGWLKARTTFKTWTKVWCQVKPGYLILYTSQEALKKHRIGVLFLSVCQVIKRPTKKDGLCFKLMNPFGCSLWAKSSTKALVFSQSSLTLRVSEESIGRIWLDALHRCNLSANLDGCKSIIDDQNAAGASGRASSQFNQSDYLSESDDDGAERTRQLESILSRSNNFSETDSLSSFNHHVLKGNTTNGNILPPAPPSLPSKKVSKMSDIGTNHGNSIASPDKCLDNHSSHFETNNNILNHVDRESNETLRTRPREYDGRKPSLSHNSHKQIVNELTQHDWRDLQLENVTYQSDVGERLGSAGAQSEEVQDGNKNIIWLIIKQLRPGMDLSKFTLPTFILEPRSFLEKLADYYYHCDILSRAVTVDDPVMRLLNIVKWYLSGFYKKPEGAKKPYNPILGEKFRCFWDHPETHSRTFFVAEQVSHHPPISAFHVSNRKDGYMITCAMLTRSKFGGNSVQAVLDGKARLYLTKRRETYTMTMPYANCRGILLGSLCLELGGKVEIKCEETRCKCEIDFRLAPMWANANSYNSLTGRILKDGDVTHTFDGHWDKRIDIVDKKSNQKSVFWEVTDAIRNSRLKRFTVDLTSQGERESVKLWSKVTEAIKTNDQTKATVEKTKLEDMQRMEARERKETFKPALFRYLNDTNDWLYKWIDDRIWDSQRDIMQFEDRFTIKTLVTPRPTSSIDSELDLPISKLSRFSNQSNTIPGCATQDSQRNDQISHANGQDTSKTESKIAAGNNLFEEALKQVTEKNRKLEEDVAKLMRARGKRTLAFFMIMVIVALLAVFLRYFA